MRPIDPLTERSSLRLRIRRGMLARSLRDDPAGDIDRREPDELFEPLEGLDDGADTHTTATEPAAARCA